MNEGDLYICYFGRNKVAAVVEYSPALTKSKFFFIQMEHGCTQYSIIPSFHYSKCERSELSSRFEAHGLQPGVHD